MPQTSASISSGGGRSAAVEVTVEICLVPPGSDLLILFIALFRINPGLGHVGFDLAVKERLDSLGKRHLAAVSLWPRR